VVGKQIQRSGKNAALSGSAPDAAKQAPGAELLV
jgi:hypothetical protein